MVRRLAVVLALATLLTSCTSDAGEDTTPEAGDTATTAAGESDEASVSASPTPGEFPPGADVLDVAVSEPSTLDPMRIQDPGSVLIARQIYEGLTRWDPDEQEVLPGVAESWEVSKSGKRFTFQLNQGMTFHDGTPITAKDFRYAFDRIAKKSNASALAYLLDRIDGFSEVNQLGESNSLSGIKTPDDHTLVIELTEPFQGLPALLTHPALVPLLKTSVEDEETFLAQPNGNGPFRVVAPWAPGGQVILERYDAYISTPSLEGLRFHAYEDAADSWIDFVSEELDVAEVPAGQVVPAAGAYGDEGYAPLLVSYSYGLNVDAPALKNIDARRAINLAIDREAIADDIYKGTMLPARGIVPSGMPGFDDDACEGVCSYEPETAAALVSELPKKSRKLTIEYTNGPPHKQVAQAVASNLQEAGFDVSTKGFAFGAYIKRLRGGQQEVFRLGWISEYPSPDGFLDALFSSDSPDNNSGFSSAAVDRLLDKATRESDARSRYALYRRAEKLILEKLPLAPIGSFVTHWAAQPYIEDIHFDVTGGFDAASIDIDR